MTIPMFSRRPRLRREALPLPKPIPRHLTNQRKFGDILTKVTRSSDGQLDGSSIAFFSFSGLSLDTSDEEGVKAEENGTKISDEDLREMLKTHVKRRKLRRRARKAPAEVSLVKLEKCSSILYGMIIRFSSQMCYFFMFEPNIIYPVFDNLHRYDISLEWIWTWKRQAKKRIFRSLNLN